MTPASIAHEGLKGIVDQEPSAVTLVRDHVQLALRCAHFTDRDRRNRRIVITETA